MRKLMLAVAIVAIAPACAHTPKSSADVASLETKSNATLNEMRSHNSNIDPVLQSAYGYAVFPNVGKAGFIAGGANGVGILYDHGHAVGSVKLVQGSFGAQIGAQTFAEVVILHDMSQMNKLKAGKLDLGANASAVVISAGAGAATPLTRGADVFIMPKGGAMVDVSVAGQQITFEPFAG